MTIMRSSDGAETFTTPVLNEDLDDVGRQTADELLVWRTQTPESTLETSPADITTYVPPPPSHPQVYQPPAFLPDGVDNLTDQEYRKLFNQPKPTLPDKMRPDLVAEVGSLDTRVRVLETPKPGPTTAPARTQATND